jgi:hypothetical protein
MKGTYSVAPLNWIKVVWPDARGTATAALKNTTRVLESIIVIDLLLILELQCNKGQN